MDDVKPALAGERFVVGCTWDDVPHLSDKEKADLWAALPPHERRQRSKGLPVLGSGLVYPFEEEHIKIDPIPLQKEWKRCFGFDTDAGAGWTAMVWLALDAENSLVYLYHCYKSPSRSKADHIEKMRSMGTKKKPLWIPGVGDARALVVTEDDARQVIELYRDAGVDIDHANKAVEAGVQKVFDLIQLKRFRVFSTCVEWFEEFRQYHRKDGKIVKVNDHLMDATRYAVFSGIDAAASAPPDEEEVKNWLQGKDKESVGLSWLGN